MKQVQKRSIPCRTFGNRRKRLHKLGQLSPLFSRKNTCSFENYVQTPVRTSSYLKTRGSSLKKYSAFPLGVWKTITITTQYSEWTVGPLNSATCSPMFMHLTGCHQPIQRFYWLENAVDWLRECL